MLVISLSLTNYEIFPVIQSMLNLSAVGQANWQFYRDHKEIIDNLLSGGLPTVVIAIFSFIGFLIGLIFSFICWYRQQKRHHQIPFSTFAFEIIKPDSNILSVVYGSDTNDPLADSRIPYQKRLANRDIQQELEQTLEECKWLLILGKTGLGKTREASELAQRFNREKWTVLWLKHGEWIDEPTREQLAEINTNRKLLLFLDDLNQRMRYSLESEKSPKAESPLEPLTIPLQERLLRTLTAYEQFCGEAEIRVIATAKNERESAKPGEPSEWDKLQWDKYPQLWNRFTVVELPEPEDEAIVALLRETILQANIAANDADYPIIAQRNDCTFRNVVENLVRLRNRNSPLTLENYRDTLTANWERRYRDAVSQYPIAQHIYDAVDLLQQFNISLEKFIVEPTARLFVRGNIWQRLWCRWRMRRVLNYLIEREGIFKPRDGQIEAKGRQVEVSEYIRPLSHLIWRLSDKYPSQMLDSLSGFGLGLYNLNRYKEALVCFNKILQSVPEIPDAEFWFYRGTTLFNLERYQEAIASYDKALEFKADKGVVWYNRGAALGNLEQYSEAIASFDKALEFKPDYYKALNNLGNALDNLGQYSEAIASYNQALAIQPDDYQAWNNRGIALGHLGQHSEAIASFDKALEFEPDDHQVWYNRGVALGHLGQHSEAITSYDKALELKPDDYQAWNNRGVALGHLGQHSEAIASYDKALEFKPDYHQAWYNKACYYALQDNIDLAIENLQYAINLKTEYREKAKTDTDFDKIRSDALFQALLKLG